MFTKIIDHHLLEYGAAGSVGLGLVVNWCCFSLGHFFICHVVVFFNPFARMFYTTNGYFKYAVYLQTLQC